MGNCFFARPRTHEPLSHVLVSVNPQAPPPPSTPEVRREPNITQLRLKPPDNSNVEIFTYRELSTATWNFHKDNILGEGGFGYVYQGLLPANIRPGYVNDVQVAVKERYRAGEQGDREWLAEIKVLGQLRHPNIVRLLGYCCEGEHRVLVYEYMEGGSLESHLFTKQGRALLSWSKRMKIALDAARALAFLHDSERCIIYRDFKAANVLLDTDFNAKISDFGMAREGPKGDQTHVSTRVMGTTGYAPPEYLQTGHLTAYGDVYSFGVVLLELLFGLRVVDSKRGHDFRNLVDFARGMMSSSNKGILEVIDYKLRRLYCKSNAEKVSKLAYECINERPQERPKMIKIIEVLESVQEDEGVGSSSSSSTPHRSDSNAAAIKGEGSRSSTTHKVPMGSCPVTPPGQTSHRSTTRRDSGTPPGQISHRSNTRRDSSTPPGQRSHRSNTRSDSGTPPRRDSGTPPGQTSHSSTTRRDDTDRQSKWKGKEIVKHD